MDQTDEADDLLGRHRAERPRGQRTALIRLAAHTVRDAGPGHASEEYRTTSGDGSRRMICSTPP